MTINFEHHQSAHCENGVISNLMNFHGHQLSEAMVFGIGGGIFFAYMPFLKINGLPVISFRLLPGQIFSRFAKNLGIKIKRDKFRNPEKGMKELDLQLEKGNPVGLVVGVYNLPYFPPEYRFHFNAHNLAVYGKENEHYLISDPVMEFTTRLTYQELTKVRYAKGLFAPKGHLYYPVNIPETFNMEKAIYSGIEKACNYMLDIPVPLFGAKGIGYLIKDILKWSKKFDGRKASQHMGQIVRSLEEIGTGGAGFRFIYAAFLQEAAQKLNKEILIEYSNEMTAIGDRWRDFSTIAGRIIKDRTNVIQPYQECANILNDIKNREIELFKKLKEFVKKNKK